MELVEKARAGDVDAAREILGLFAETVEEVKTFRHPERAWRGQIPWDIAAYLAEAFRAILAGKDGTGRRMTADIALNLSARGKRGPKAKAATRRNSLDRGLEVWNEYKSASGLGDLPLADGRNFDPSREKATPIERAIGAIAQKHNLSAETARRDYMEWRKVLEKAADELMGAGR